MGGDIRTAILIKYIIDTTETNLKDFDDYIYITLQNALRDVNRWDKEYADSYFEFIVPLRNFNINLIEFKEWLLKIKKERKWKG